MIDDVISKYSLDDAQDDGMVKTIGIRGVKRLVVTAGVFSSVSVEEQFRLFSRFFDWQRNVEPSLLEEDRMFVSETSDHDTVWVIDDGCSVTLLYPSEY